MMKKIIVTLVALLFVSSAFSQIENLKLGGGLCYGTDLSDVDYGVGSLGISFVAGYSITEEISASIGFTKFLKQKETIFGQEIKYGFSAFDIEGQYKFYETGSGIDLYGIAGISFVTGKVDELTYTYTVPFAGTVTQTIPSSKDTDTGLNLGIGASIDVSDNISVAPELRFTLMDPVLVRIGASAFYNF